MKVSSEVIVLNFPLSRGGGRVILREGSGLGIELDESYVRKHAVAVRVH